MIFLRYQKHLGYLAWAGHRVTGIVLTLYLFAHMYVLSNIRDAERFGKLMEMTRNPLVKGAELLLLLAVAIHAINGVRLTALDLGAPTKSHKPLLWASAIGCALITAAGAVAFFGGAH